MSTQRAQCDSPATERGFLTPAGMCPQVHLKVWKGPQTQAFAHLLDESDTHYLLRRIVTIFAGFFHV